MGLMYDRMSSRLYINSVPWQAEHLAHWGINMMNMQKSEKTMAEMQIDLNMAYEGRITEAGSALQPLSGPGYDFSTELLLLAILLDKERSRDAPQQSWKIWSSQGQCVSRKQAEGCVSSMH